MQTTLPVGTTLRVIGDLFNPINGALYPAESIFTISSNGPDNKFGFYQMKCPDGTYMLYEIKNFEVVS